MAAIILRTVKGSSLTNAEVDSNFNAINNELITKLPTSVYDAGITVINSAIAALQADVTTALNSKLSNAAGAIDTANYGNGTVTPPKLSTGGPTWTSGGAVSVSGQLTAASIFNSPISGSTGAFTTLSSSGACNLGVLVATSINNTPIGAATPSTGKFSTLESVTANITGNATLGTTAGNVHTVNGSIVATGNYSGTTASFNTSLTVNGLATSQQSKIVAAAPQLIFQDTDHNSGFITVNTNVMYIQRAGVSETTPVQVGGQWPFTFNLVNNDATCGGNFIAAGNVSAYSDIRVKTDIQPIENALDKLAFLNGVTFLRTDRAGLADENTRQTGLIAQEVLLALPEAVIEDPNGLLSVNYGSLVGLLVEAIKELQKEIAIIKLAK